MSMGSYLVDGGEHSRGKTLHWMMLILGDHKEGVCVWGGSCVCGGDTIMLKENSSQLLRGTGWWLGASRAVSALAKEAEVQGNGTAPMRAGTRK